MLIDIICMANNLVDKDAYIIIDVDEENDYSSPKDFMTPADRNRYIW